MATCGLKQEAVLLHQDVEQSPYQHHVTLQCPANFLHFLQSENIGSPDGDPIISVVQTCLKCLEKSNGKGIIIDNNIFNSYCDDCRRIKSVCEVCQENGHKDYHPFFRGCTTCQNVGEQCVKVVIMVYGNDCEEKIKSHFTY